MTNSMNSGIRAVYHKHDLLGREFPAVLPYGIRIPRTDIKKAPGFEIRPYDPATGTAAIGHTDTPYALGGIFVHQLWQSITWMPDQANVSPDGEFSFKVDLVNLTAVDCDAERAKVGTLIIPAARVVSRATNMSPWQRVCLVAFWENGDETLIPAINRMLWEYETEGLTGSVRLVASKWSRPLDVELPEWTAYSDDAGYAKDPDWVPA